MNYNTYDKINDIYKVSATNSKSVNTSLKDFKALARNTRTKYQNKKADVLIQADKMKEKYNHKAISDFIAAENEKIAKEIESDKTDLYNRVNGIMAEKRETLKKYITVPPTDEQLRLLQAFSIRGAEVPENELVMLIEKMGNNYQALESAKSIANKNGYDLASFVNVDAELEELDKITEVFSNMVNWVDKEESTMGYLPFMFYNYDEDCDNYINSQIDKYDNSAVFSFIENPDEIKLTPMQKLDKALDEAIKNGDAEKELNVKEYKSKHYAELETAEEKADRINKEIDSIVS